jgi:spore maturation protein CgeB
LSAFQRDLTTREIQDSVKFLTKIADVTVAVDMKNTDKMLEALQNLGTLDVM